MHCSVWGNRALGPVGCMVGLTVNSKRVYTKGEVQDFPQDCCCQGPRLCGEPRPITPPLETLQQVVLIQSPVGALLLSSGSWCTQDFACALQDWSLCFPESCGSLVIKSHWPSRPDSLDQRIPSPLLDPETGKPDAGFRTFTTVGELLWYYCSPVCGSPSWWVWDLILS